MIQKELEAERDSALNECLKKNWCVESGEGYSDLTAGFEAGWDAAMEHMPKWTPVSEGLPNQGHHVLVADNYGNTGLAYHDGSEWHSRYFVKRASETSAWMPLPEAYKP